MVIGISERLALLEIAEEKKMDYFEFTDWIVNWVQVHCDRIGRGKYGYRPGDYREPPIVGNYDTKTVAYCSWRFGHTSDKWGPDPDWLEKVPEEIVTHFKKFRRQFSTRQRASTVVPF